MQAVAAIRTQPESEPGIEDLQIQLVEKAGGLSAMSETQVSIIEKRRSILFPNRGEPIIKESEAGMNLNGKKVRGEPQFVGLNPNTALLIVHGVGL